MGDAVTVWFIRASISIRRCRHSYITLSAYRAGLSSMFVRLKEALKLSTRYVELNLEIERRPHQWRIAPGSL